MQKSFGERKGGDWEGEKGFVFFAAKKKILEGLRGPTTPFPPLVPQSSSLTFFSSIMPGHSNFTPGVARKLFATNKELVDAKPYDSMHEFFEDFHSAVIRPTSVVGSVILVRAMKLIWDISHDNTRSMKIGFKTAFGSDAREDCRRFIEDVETIKRQFNEGLFVIDQTIRDACTLFENPKIVGRSPFYSSGETKGSHASSFSKRIFQMAEGALLRNKILPCVFEQWLKSPVNQENDAEQDDSPSNTPPDIVKEHVTNEAPAVEKASPGPIYPEPQIPLGRGKMPRSLPGHAGVQAAEDGRPRGRYSKALNFTPSMDRLLALQEEDEEPRRSSTVGQNGSSSSTDESKYHHSIVSLAGVPITHIPPAPQPFVRQRPVDDTPSPKRRRTLRHDDPSLFGVHVRREALAQVFLHLGMAMQTLYHEFAEGEEESEEI